eukprot:CAMPEP_0184689504 /NCGR_PEP_ID=MMETSP0312-20130426/30692_1 /TAXON_ID=31354 /ORGANISM="Compsopogon coeruleus, Strain SAG 36.94" /LENGTH=1155 /DNA_ID=CAMNT_0027146859 /DNA_START=2062 /DNA_END=5529 /DNA_ORIENTATION=+
MLILQTKSSKMQLGSNAVVGVIALLVVLNAASVVSAGTAQIMGERKVWHKITLTWKGPYVKENDNPSPFLNYRLTVTFTKGPKKFIVPGYFAADGNAAESSASEGDQWRCNFTPDENGTWTYVVSFVKGDSVAITNVGGTGTHFDGDNGSFSVSASDKQFPDFRQRGRLSYIGARYLQFEGTKDFFLKIGSDSPEGLFDYADIDNTPEIKQGMRRSWAKHVQDWKSGDPTWQGRKGQGLIGAVNYLSSENLNALSFLTHSFNGSDGNVFVYNTPEDKFHLDVSKLAQWEIVVDHMNAKGLFAHFKLCEIQSVAFWDDGNLGAERKLYYRELVARFSHLLAMNWNLGEEIINPRTVIPIINIKQFATYIKSLDPYKHPVVLHTWPVYMDVKEPAYNAMLGYPDLDGVSLQSHSEQYTTFDDAKTWIDRSAKAGHQWVASSDEQGPWESGILADSIDPEHDSNRSSVLWPHFLGGGAGHEVYAGWNFFPQSDLTLDDFRARSNWYAQMRRIPEFLNGFGLPFWEMQSSQSISINGQYTFYKPGTVYVTQLNHVKTTFLNIGNDTIGYRIHWWNPKRGGELQDGTIQCVSGGGIIPLGHPSGPEYEEMDWIAILRPEFVCNGTGNPYLEGPCKGVHVSSRVDSFDRFSESSQMELNLYRYPKTSSTNDVGVKMVLNTGLCRCQSGWNAAFEIRGNLMTIALTMQGYSFWVKCLTPWEVNAESCRPLLETLDGKQCAVSGKTYKSSLSLSPWSKETPPSPIPSTATLVPTPNPSSASVPPSPPTRSPTATPKLTTSPSVKPSSSWTTNPSSVPPSPPTRPPTATPKLTTSPSVKPTSSSMTKPGPTSSPKSTTSPTTNPPPRTTLQATASSSPKQTQIPTGSPTRPSQKPTEDPSPSQNSTPLPSKTAPSPTLPKPSAEMSFTSSPNVTMGSVSSSPTSSLPASPSPTSLPTNSSRTQSPLPDGGSAQAAACFPGDALVQLDDGRTLPMEHLHVGDRVRVGSTQYSTVYLFGHKLPHQPHRYLRIHTANATLELSSNHFVYVLILVSSPTAHTTRLLPAKLLRTGMKLVNADGSSETITQVTNIQRTGLYNPHTLQGDLIVNGFLVSSYNAFADPGITHWLLLPERLAYRVGLSIIHDALHTSRPFVVSRLLTAWSSKM